MAVAGEMRLVAYQNLAKIFSYPMDVADLATLKQALEQLSVALAGLGLDAEEALRRAREQLSGASAEEILRQLRIGYTRLFVTAYPRVPAPPYESVYVDEGGVWGKSTAAVLRKYGEYGVTLQSSVREPPDHFGAELEFMAYLLALSSDPKAAEGRLADEPRAFFQQHLGRWYRPFLGRVLEHGGDGFYGYIAAAALAFLEHEEHLLAK